MPHFLIDILVEWRVPGPEKAQKKVVSAYTSHEALAERVAAFARASPGETLVFDGEGANHRCPQVRDESGVGCVVLKEVGTKPKKFNGWRVEIGTYVLPCLDPPWRSNS